MVVDEDGACAALVDPAAILRACEPKLRAKDPEKVPVPVGAYPNRVPIQGKFNRVGHKGTF